MIILVSNSNFDLDLPYLLPDLILISKSKCIQSTVYCSLTIHGILITVHNIPDKVVLNRTRKTVHVSACFCHIFHFQKIRANKLDIFPNMLMTCNIAIQIFVLIKTPTRHQDTQHNYVQLTVLYHADSKLWAATAGIDKERKKPFSSVQQAK